MNDTEMEILQGTISAVVFQNYENGYAVLRLAAQDGNTVTVVGTIPMPSVGEQLMVTGRWGNHSGYGRQFEAEFLERLLPQTESQILAFLSGRAVKGIGPKTAGRIVSRFGAKTLEIMEREPEQLAQVPGISPAKAKAIGEEFRLRTGARRLMEFFAQHDLDAQLAVRVYRMYGEGATDLLYDDPYLLMEDGLDASFGAVDRFAISLGVAGDDHRRVEAGILFELRYNLTAGHSFLPKEKLAAATAQLLSVDVDTVNAGLDRLAEGERVVPETLAGIPVIYLPELAEAEAYTAMRLLQFAADHKKTPPDLDKMVRIAASESGLTYSAQQEQAIRDAASCGVLMVTGGPGTGKTSIVNGILSLFDQMGVECQLAAPTGRAAKRLTEVTGREASTIHRLLEAGIDPNTGMMYFAKDESNPLKAGAIVVDEMSMVDISLLSQLLHAIPAGKRLILVGDPDQLPPVGPGFPFGDMLRSEALPTVRLTEIFRQARESLIVMNAHRINQGQMPDLRDRKRDFFFLPCRSEQEVGATIAGLCATRLPKNMGIPSGEIQVLSPTRKGGVGTGNLNVLLQNALNPASPEKRERKYRDFAFREGDRVMQIRNNYDIPWKKTDGTAVGSGIYNGDIGVITGIEPEQELVRVVFDDRVAEYDFTMLEELEPAYAITVHKSQGSEYRAVILSCWGGSPYLLNRSVLYTAVTRARELLILVGREDTVGVMVNNAKVGRRYTGLKLRLQGRTKC